MRTDNHLGFIGSDPDKLWRLWHTGVVHGTVRRKRGITVFALTSGKPRLREDGQDSKSLTQQNHAVSEMTEHNPGCEIIIYSSQAVFLVLPFKITSIKKFTNLPSMSKAPVSTLNAHSHPPAKACNTCSVSLVDQPIPRAESRDRQEPAASKSAGHS